MTTSHTLRPEERKRRRAELLQRFALMGDGGQPMRHGVESPWSNDYKSEGKVCLASEGYARRFAAALLYLGEDEQEAYACDAGHWHLRQIRKARAAREQLKRRREGAIDGGKTSHPRGDAGHVGAGDAEQPGGVA